MSAADALAPPAQNEFVRALELHLPGLEIVDRDLEIRHGKLAVRVATLVARAVDSSKGDLLVLIEGLDGPSGPAALRALELSALVREHGPELARRYECARGPALALLADEGARELGTLLAPLLGERLLLFSCTELRSRAGARFGIAPLSTARDVAAAPTRADFLAGLDEAARALAEAVWQCLDSPALGARAEIGGASVRWSDARGPLCSLVRSDSGLSGRLTGLDEPLGLASEPDGRAFLDAVLALHLQRLGQKMEDPARTQQQAAFDPRQPVLSEAEIAAFHD